MRPNLKLPRISIATLFVLIVLFAIDCTILRHPFGGNDAAMLSLCTLPMANILAFGLYRDVACFRRGTRSPFRFGFELAGWAALFAFLFGCNTFPDPFSSLLGRVYFPVRELCMDNLPFDTMKALDPIFLVTHKIATAVSLFAVSMVLTLIFLCVAIAGGWACRRLERVTRRPAITA